MKHAYEILSKIYGNSPMQDLVRFKSELDAIGDKHDYFDIVWEEAFYIDDNAKPETLRKLNNTIILSSIWASGPFETIEDEGREVYAVKLFHFLHQFFNKCIDLEIFKEKRQFLHFSNELLTKFFECDNYHPEDLSTQNIFTINNLYVSLIDYFNKGQSGNGHFFAWSSNGVLFEDEKYFFKTVSFTHDLRISVTLYVFALAEVFERFGNKIIDNPKLISDTKFYFDAHKKVYEDLSEEEFQDDFQKFIYKGEKYKLSHKKKISYSEHLNSIFSSLQLIEFLNYDCFGEEDITDFISNHLKICFGQ